MTILSVSDAACMAGVKLATLKNQIDTGILSRTSEGVDVSELIRVYPDLKPLAGLKLKAVKQPGVKQTKAKLSSDAIEGQLLSNGNIAQQVHVTTVDTAVSDIDSTEDEQKGLAAKSTADTGTVKLLIRELEWNKELLEQTNQLMAKQLADQRALIADQARRLDEKDRFWARQVEIAQSLLAAPEPRKKFLGIF